MFSIQGYYSLEKTQKKNIEGLQNISYKRTDDDNYIWCITDRGRLALRNENNSNSWTNLYGNMKNVSSSGIGNIWTIANDDKVYKCEKNCINGSFEQPDPNIRLKQLSAKKEYVWGVDADGYIHKAPNDGSLPFTKVTDFKNVAGSKNYAEFYGINNNDEIYKCSQISGNIKQIDSDETDLWGIDSGDNVYKCKLPCNDGKWKKMGSKIKYVSAAYGKKNVWAIANDNRVLKCRKPCNSKWDEVDGRVKDIG